ncbi:extracellular solute-binding protein [Desulfococcaceae bacterium OttesenSCG-928-F15]|nr:extracellular solute-binding protein [Desulfococcaceae bacterium OttesenSCG-928-F15]
MRMWKRISPLMVGFCLLMCGTLWAGESLHVYNWSEYMPEEVLVLFEKETGIKVIYTTYDSNEAMYAKLTSPDGKGYDLIFPSTYYVDKMRREGLLKKLDKSLLPGLENVEHSLLDKGYDPGNEYSVPYLWGSTGIGINTEQLNAEGLTQFADFWAPRFKGKVMLTDDKREVFAMALRVLGYSGNSTSEAEIMQAYAKLLDLMPNIRLFSAESQRQVLLSGETPVGSLWNGEAYMAALENPAIQFIYPREGAIFWLDSMVIPRDAANVEGAHKFINFILKPEIAKMITEEIGYTTPNKAAQALLDPGVASNPTVYPPEEVILNGEFQVDVGDAISIYQHYWDLLKGH